MDYKNGKIYKLICSETQQIYIGSTTQPLYKRLHHHKSKKNRCTSKDLIEPKIFLIEDFPCERKEQLHARERHHIENTECVNLYIPIRFGDENQLIENEWKKKWYLRNKERLLKKHKEYHLKNKNNEDYQKKRQEQRDKKKGTKKICECGVEVEHSGLARHKKTKKHLKKINSIKSDPPNMN